MRELFAGGLEAASMLLTEYGFSDEQVREMVDIFAKHDKTLLDKTVHEQMSMDDLIKTSKQGREELATLFKRDRHLNEK